MYFLTPAAVLSLKGYWKGKKCEQYKVLDTLRHLVANFCTKVNFCFFFPIEDKAYGTVLGLRNDSTELGTMVELEIKDKPQSDEQRWVREMSDEDGWFRFKNPLSGRVLSVQTFSSITIAGKEMNFIHYVFKLYEFIWGTITLSDHFQVIFTMFGSSVIIN